ncbi:hypothetical protein R9X47_25575 [Wukongibacter baidiensis]|uniref:hypothetical protein n=1 Tax=Wukongibacter baidiensis TaxID=1723361 RepID=UPI003D7F992A
MNLIQDIVLTNKNIITKSFKLAAKNWKIFLVGIAYLFIMPIMGIVVSYAGILGGIIISIFQSAIVSNYLYLIENIINYGRFTMEDFKSGFTVYLWKTYSIFIFFYLVRWGKSLFLDPLISSMGMIGVYIQIAIVIAAFVMLNTIPEVIYQKHYERLDLITYTFDFTKENFLEWFIPNGLIFAVAYIIHISTSQIIFLIGFGSSFVLSSIIRSIIYQLILAYAMIYRGQLFKILSTSTRRKRMFMRDMYK